MEERKDKQDAQRIILIKETLVNAEKNLQAAKALLSELESKYTPQKKSYGVAEGGKIVEGTFDGQIMIGQDGRQYPVPANYASKSKLVEGDMLKLVISDDGNFIYKQIGPVKRKRLIGMLNENPKEGGFEISSEGNNFKVLLAAVTYHKASVGDEIAFVVADNDDAQWGAIENVLKKTGVDGTEQEVVEEVKEENQEEGVSKESILDASKKEEKTKETKKEPKKKDTKKKKKEVDKEWSPDLEEIEKELKGEDKVEK